MSTNFYWKFEQPASIQLANGQTIDVSVDDMDPRIHIGKYSLGRAGGKFTWAQSQSTVRTLCDKYPEEPIIVDEYKQEVTGKAFRELLDGINQHETDSIGTWFC